MEELDWGEYDGWALDLGIWMVDYSNLLKFPLNIFLQFSLSSATGFYYQIFWIEWIVHPSFLPDRKMFLHSRLNNKDFKRMVTGKKKTFIVNSSHKKSLIFLFKKSFFFPFTLFKCFVAELSNIYVNGWLRHQQKRNEVSSFL